jgi:hypothetical protein
MSDRLVRSLSGVALAVVLSAWMGSIAGVVSWRLSAPSLPGPAWGQELAAGLFPGVSGVRVDVVPEIARYEEAEVQKSNPAFFLLGGDDYFPGQVVMTATVNSPRDVIAAIDTSLRENGWTVGSHEPGEDATATSSGLTLWVTEVYPDEVEVSVYRQTPTAVFWATGIAAAAGAVLGFVLGAALSRRVRPGSRARSSAVLGAALSLPAAIVAVATMVAELFAADHLYPFIPWDAYMYGILRPLAILGVVAFGVAAVLWAKERAGAEPLTTV